MISETQALEKCKMEVEHPAKNQTATYKSESSGTVSNLHFWLRIKLLESIASKSNSFSPKMVNFWPGGISKCNFLFADPVFLTASSQQLKNRKRHSICGSIDNSEGTNPVTVSKKSESVLVPNEENRGSSQEIIFSGSATETWLCQPAIYSFSTAGGCHK